jgi:putative OPT family oligopeptide transporter
MAEKLTTPPAAPPAATFRPYIPPEQSLPELTIKAALLGALFGLIFGAVTVYLALRAGLTVSASIPIAVLAIAVFKKIGSTILENNIVQTAGSAGESIAAGVAFTMPALIFLGFAEYFTVPRIFLVALVGGCLGVLFMIPLRRYLIVKEHGTLLYPEGTACADVLIAGERGGSFAGRVFWGLGLGGIYQFLMQGLHFWNETPTYDPRWYPGGRIAGNITPEYMGVGYIIGPKIAGTIFAGGVFSWLVLIPAIKFFGAGLTQPVFPGTIPISEMTPDVVWARYIRPIGAGAVAAAGLFTLYRTIPTIIDSFRAGARDLMAGREGAGRESRIRTEQDLPLTVVLGGSLALVIVIWGMLQFAINPGVPLGNFAAAILMVIFGFLFVTVSSRIVGILGSSSNPISGMTIATLMATSLIFVMVGWTAGAFPAVALSIGAVVCIAAANGGATSQDLKTGYLVGATPWRQQIALIIGALASVLVIGYTITYLNYAYSTVRPVNFAVDARTIPEVKSRDTVVHGGRTLDKFTIIGSHQVPDGTYYADQGTGQIQFQLAHGIGSTAMPAPQALLMSTVINGILSRNLPWGLVLIGVFLVVAIELMGIRSLSFAVGAYLPIATTSAIFGGSVIRWAADRALAKRGTAAAAHGEGEVGSGALFSSGLIAAGSLVGLLIVAPLNAKRREVPDFLVYGPKWFGGAAESALVGLVAFIALGAALYYFARKPLDAK